MTLLFTDGFDVNDIGYKWTYYNPTSTALVTGRFGTGGARYFYQAANSACAWQYFTPSATVICGGAYFVGVGGTTWSIWGDRTATRHLDVYVSSQGGMNVSRGGTVLVGAQAGTISLTAWQYVEIKATIHPTAGYVEVRVNGVAVMIFTGNTKNGGTDNSADTFGYYSGDSAVTHYIDDFYVCNGLGTANNNFLGDIRVQVLLPTGVGSSTQLTPTGVINNWDNVNDSPPNSATYNSSSLPGQRDTYAMGDLATTTGQVFGIQETVVFLKTDAGSASMKAALKSGASLVYDPTQILTPSALMTSVVRETDPNTSMAWDVNGVNAIEFGAEVV